MQDNLTTAYVEELFRREDYYTLEHLLHPLDRVADDRFGWSTLLFRTMIEDNVRVFRHFISTYGIQIMDEQVGESGDEDGWQGLWRIMYEGGSGIRPKMALYETLLDEDGTADKKMKDYDGIVDLHVINPWRVSNDQKRKSLSAAVWCCKAIRSFGADGLEEVLGKRLQAASTWDWEPKMKRCKY